MKKILGGILMASLIFTVTTVVVGDIKIATLIWATAIIMTLWFIAAIKLLTSK